MRAAAAIPAIAMAAGAALVVAVPAFPSAWAFGLLIAGAAATLWSGGRGRPRALGVSVAVTFAAGAALLTAQASRTAERPPLRVVFEQLSRRERARLTAEGRAPPEEVGAFATVEGVLRSDAALSASGVALAMDVDQIEAVGRPARQTAGGVAAIVVGSLAPASMGRWRAGRRIRVPIELRRPTRYLDPGVPDAERRLARRGTTLVGTVKSGALVDVVAKAGPAAEVLGTVRAFARHAIAQAVGRWSRRSAAVVAAIVIGDRGGLDPAVEQRLQEAGTYHVIAISGAHVAVLAGLLLGIFRGCGVLGPAAMLTALTALVGYAQLVGGGPSVDRATFMAVVYLAGRALDHRGSTLNTLAVAAACLLAVSPLSVADAGFVLTFGATLGILTVAPVLMEQIAADDPERALRGWRRRWPAVALSMFAASAAAEAALFPVIAVVFSRVTVAGLALNFVAIPCMALAQLSGMALVPVALVSRPAAAALGLAAHVGAAGLVRSAGLARLVPLLSYRVAAPSWVAVAGYYAGGIAAWVLWRRRTTGTGSLEPRWARRCRRMAAATTLLSAIWIAAEPWAVVARRGDGRLHVLSVDVGQGDATIVRFPRGTTLLVDAGGGSGTFDVGDRVVAPVLRDLGVRRLAVLALTHGDPDHIGGAASILREFRPQEVWEGIPVPPFEPLRLLREAAAAGGARWVNVRTGDRVAIDGVEVVVRHPGPPDWERQRVRNDDSIVLELRWRGVSVVLPGDIGRPVERVLALPPGRLRVLKVPHHGSLTSSSAGFIAALAPRIALVSAGRSNHFGHPAPAVLERYRARGVRLFRTDRDGAITIDTDGRALTVRTFTGRSAVAE